MKICSKLRHENLIRMLATCSTTGSGQSLLAVSEYTDHGDLNHFLAGKDITASNSPSSVTLVHCLSLSISLSISISLSHYLTLSLSLSFSLSISHYLTLYISFSLSLYHYLSLSLSFYRSLSISHHYLSLSLSIVIVYRLLSIYIYINI